MVSFTYIFFITNGTIEWFSYAVNQFMFLQDPLVTKCFGTNSTFKPLFHCLETHLHLGVVSDIPNLERQAAITLENKGFRTHVISEWLFFRIV
jgi:hypothetical protein